MKLKKINVNNQVKTPKKLSQFELENITGGIVLIKQDHKTKCCCFPFFNEAKTKIEGFYNDKRNKICKFVADKDVESLLTTAIANPNAESSALIFEVHLNGKGEKIYEAKVDLIYYLHIFRNEGAIDNFFGALNKENVSDRKLIDHISSHLDLEIKRLNSREDDIERLKMYGILRKRCDEFLNPKSQF